MISPTIPALILAGSRPGPDPLLSGTNIATKALLPIAGEPMLIHVVRALRASSHIGEIIILAQDSADLAKIAVLQTIPDLRFENSGAGISTSLSAALPQSDQPMLITTADHVLLTPQMVDEFIAGARGFDVGVAMVEKKILLARYPSSRRTWLKFRGGSWSGANLFWMRGQKAQPLLKFWSGIERDRKKGLKIIAAFGPMLMIGALLRFFTIQQGVSKAGQRFGIKAGVVAMSAAEACIDADKPDDIVLIEHILADRNST